MTIKKLTSVLLLPVFLLSACSNTGGNNEIEEKVTPVYIQKVSKGQISDTFTYGGEINPKQQITVSSKVAGKVKEVYFDIGDYVKEGVVLFQLDETDLQNNIKALEAQLKSAQATVNMGQIALSSAKGSQYKQQKSQMETALKNAEIQLQDSKKAYEDMKVLYEMGSVSKQQLDQSESAYQMALLAYQAAKNNYDLFMNNLSKESVQLAQNQLEQAVAAKESLEVQIANAKEALNDTAVRSPIDGIVSSRMIDAGEMVAGAIAPFTIIQIDQVFVDVYVSEQIINKIEKNQKVDVYVRSASTDKFEGKIAAISPAADERTFTYLVKVEIDNQGGLLKPGMFAEVEFVLDSANNVIVIPREAILTEGDRDFVYIVEGDRAKKIEVKLGLDNGKEAAILEGLKEGMEIVIKGQEYLLDGGKVQIVEQ